MYGKIIMCIRFKSFSIFCLVLCDFVLRGSCWDLDILFVLKNNKEMDGEKGIYNGKNWKYCVLF